ncbi:hypothetical protein HDU93_009285 [Gonapodya sp. JEL0774]|nr:hypothetical protein HDU93_009285 [Gonapodya sp. JEL0774]
MLSPYMTYDHFKKRIETLNNNLPRYALYQGLNLFIYLVFVPISCILFFVWASDPDRENRTRLFDLVMGTLFLLISINWVIQTRVSNRRFSKALNLMLAEFNAQDEPMGICWTSRARLHRWDFRLMGVKTPPIEVVTIIILRPLMSPTATSPHPVYAALTEGETVSASDTFQAIQMEAVSNARSAGPSSPTQQGRRVELEGVVEVGSVREPASVGAFVGNVNVVRKSPLGLSHPPAMDGNRFQRLE